jgi:hypothetical protein
MQLHRTLIAELLAHLEDVAQNVNYPEDFPNERCLVNP